MLNATDATCRVADEARDFGPAINSLPVFFSFFRAKKKKRVEREACKRRKSKVLIDGRIYLSIYMIYIESSLGSTRLRCATIAVQTRVSLPEGSCDNKIRNAALAREKYENN